MTRRHAHSSSAAPAIGFFLYGAFALIAQLLCLQELLIVFAGHELFLGVSLAAWMGWVGAGSYVARRRPSTALGELLAWLIPLLVANLVVIRLTKCVFGFGMLVGLLPMLSLTAALLAPIGLAVGALFTWGCERAHARCGLSVGAAYLWDALGTAFGGLCYTWLIAGRLAPEGVLLGLALATAAVAGVLSKNRLLAAGLAVAVGLLWAASPVSRWTRQLQWRGYTLMAEHQSRYTHVVLAKTGGLFSLFENGVISAHFPDPAAYEELVHWPLLAHPAPRRALIIGGAATGSLSELLKHPLTQADYVELDPAILQLLQPTLPPADRQALEDPRVRIIHRDGRRWLSHTSQRYDVILLQLPEPMNAQINRLYTLEAFRAIRERLNPDGLFAFTIPSSENYLSPETAYFNASLHRTLRAVFPAVELIAGDPLLLLAGLQELRVSPQLLAARYEQRRLSTREVVPSYFPIKLDAQRRAALLERLTSVRIAGLNRDFVPVCYASAWRVWISKFVSPLYFLGMLGLVAAAAVLLRTLWRRRTSLARAPGSAALVALGAAGMVYETILLLAFQSINGYVYWQLGSLFAAFMLGLAIGSALAVPQVARLTEHAAGRWLRIVLLVTGLEGLALAGILPALQHLPLQLPLLIPFSLLLLISALWLGLAFPIASRLIPSEHPALAAGTLYAADLWGASIGAVFTSAFLVPLIGLTATTGFVGLLLLIAAWALPQR